MSVKRAFVMLAGLLGCIVFSGFGLYSVNADGHVETVVDGYAVMQPAK